MKNFKFFLITLLAAASCCAVSVNAEEAEVLEETQVTEAPIETTVSTDISEITTTTVTTTVEFNLKYKAVNDHIEIIGCDGRAENIIIPAEIDNLPVTAISGTAFYNNDSIKSIEFPDSIKIM